MPRALLVVDLEATCRERAEHRAEEMETIEIGAVRVEPGSAAPAREFQTFVPPARHPVLSRFCRELTTTIRARSAHLAGIAFHAPDASHFLARSIPPEFIEFPDD
jgi:inhibitor of KinA sporulation pathway (predicted exonuclease)